MAKRPAKEKNGQTEDRIESIRRGKLNALREKGINPFANDFRRDTMARTLREKFPSAPEDHGGEPVDDRDYAVAGRIMALRSFGKAAFASIQDASGRMQVFIKKDILGADTFFEFRQVEVGDHIGAVGKPFFTKTGELTILASQFRILTKAIRPLPEKWHGLKDVETRYRQRYLDLISNEEVRDIFRARSAIISALRKYMDENSFLEVETPMMHSIPGGAAAKPFITKHNALDLDLFLRIAPELFLKRLLVGGLERVYEIGRSFRNEGLSRKHNPEFTMLEFYEAYATYEDLMTRIEEMVVLAAGVVEREFPDLASRRDFEIKPPFRRVSMRESVRDYLEKTHAPADVLKSEDSFTGWIKQKGADVPSPVPGSEGERLVHVFEEFIEPDLGPEPVFILEHPIEVSPLARRNEKDPGIVDRFELYLGGQELANAFSELNDPDDQASRFRIQAEARASGDEEAMAYDEDYVRALEHGMPPAGGLGLGIDRLVIHLCAAPGIREVILFPLLRPAE